MLEIMLEHCFFVDWMLFARIESVLRLCEPWGFGIFNVYLVYAGQKTKSFEGMM